MSPKDSSQVLPIDVARRAQADAHKARREAEHAFNVGSGAREAIEEIRKVVARIEAQCKSDHAAAMAGIGANSEAIGILTTEVASLAKTLKGEMTLAARISQLHLDEEDTQVRERRAAAAEKLAVARRRRDQWKVVGKVVGFLTTGGGLILLGNLLSRC